VGRLRRTRRSLAQRARFAAGARPGARSHGRGRLAALLAVAAAAAGVVAVAGCGHDRPASPRAQAVDAARSFLDRYADGDGRVVRRDQGGDTVSEGQAYGLLAALAAGDRARFDRVWAWTDQHLRRPDGLLSWHWAGGRVVDPQTAADADLDTAHALKLASRRFREPGLARESRRMADAMRGAEIRDGVVTAGGWARDQGVLNPSYVDPRALRDLHMDDVAGASRAALAPLLGAGGPPPDWATAGPPVAAAGPPGAADAKPGYGFDAARVPIRLAASCDPADRRLAAGMTGLQDAAPTDHPVFTVARAAQALAAGDRASERSLLDDAGGQDADHPTYYGAAWVALGRAMLDTNLLGSCSARA
jgi:endoglucanase